jgi:hypothetical protein
MTGQQWYDDDEALLAELRRAVEVGDDPGAARLIADAKACFTWHSVDQELELLTLTHDSSVAEAAFRSGTAQGPRMLVFENDDVTVHLEVGSDTLIGQMVPSSPASVVLEHVRGSITETQADDAGYFLFRRPPAGAIRVRILTSPELVTAWLTI